MGGRGTGLDRGSGKFSATSGGAGGGLATLDGYGSAEQAMARKIFGANISEKDIIDMAGAGAFDIPTRVEIGVRGNTLEVNVYNKLITKDFGDGGGLKQTFYRDKQGAKIYMDSFFLKAEAQGKGLGGKSLYMQKEAATKNGVKEINLHALRDNNPKNPAVGHRVWGDLGFNAPLTSRLQNDYMNANPMEKFAGKAAPKTVRELYERRGGREFWHRKADALTEMTMKLTKGSKSVKVLDAYALRKGWKK